MTGWMKKLEVPGEGSWRTGTRGLVWAAFLAALSAVVAAVVFSTLQLREADAATTVGVRTCDGKILQLNTPEHRIFTLQNQARAANGLPALCLHRQLTNAARSHSQEMLDKDYFSHNSHNGETDIARMQRFGYTASGYSFVKYGENIYRGSGTFGTPSRAHSWWMNSPGHRANILDPDFREVGIGVRAGDYQGEAGTRMYTVDFGVRRR